MKPSNLSISKDYDHNRELASFADYIFIAVRPTVVPVVLAQIKDLISDKIVISLASVSKNIPIRIMPNLAIANGHGVIGLYADKKVSRAKVAQVKKLLSGLGLVVDCKKESDLDTLTLMSGSGIAVAAYLMQTLAGYGVKRGMDAKLSQQVVTAVFKGALKCLKEDKATFSQFIEAVATKGGTTEVILADLTKSNFPKKFLRAMSIGEKRIKALKRKI